jgi:hypothetical protein
MHKIKIQNQTNPRAMSDATEGNNANGPVDNTTNQGFDQTPGAGKIFCLDPIGMRCFLAWLSGMNDGWFLGDGMAQPPPTPDATMAGLPPTPGDYTDASHIPDSQLGSLTPSQPYGLCPTFCVLCNNL